MNILQRHRFLFVQRALERNNVDLAEVVLFTLRSIELGDLERIISEYNISGKDFLNAERHGIVGSPEGGTHCCSLFTIQMLSQRQNRRALCSLLQKVLRQDLLNLRNSPPPSNHLNPVQIIHGKVRHSQSLVNRSQNLSKHVLHPALEITSVNVCSKILLFEQPFDPKASLLVGRKNMLGLLGCRQQFLQSSLVVTDGAKLGILLLESNLHLLCDNNISKVSPSSVRETTSQSLQHWSGL
mmetsp:Transcript_54642/g.119802  ORF Transcript_54642/g.119802 Transcript_54642/m.119802 type:complete len:240 (-) Transcript_54642:925-1644(-)